VHFQDGADDPADGLDLVANVVARTLALAGRLGLSLLGPDEEE
jgi:hypothetical protein